MTHQPVETPSSKGDLSTEDGATPAAPLTETSGGMAPWIAGGCLLLAGMVAFHPVTVTWNTNPNYSFGWWVPVLALFIFIERWGRRPVPRPSETRGNWIPALALWGLVFFIFRLAAEADPDWRPGLWVLVGLFVASLPVWLWLYGGWGWVRHFAFPVGFLLLGLPWFFGLEQWLVQNLMRMNTLLVTHALHVLGIPATAAGNIIELPHAMLGVEEACSGILSLQASLMIGCLLGEVYRLTLPRRLGLVALAMGFALVGNFGRTSFLALMAFYRGNEAVTRWHDTAGLSILVLTVVSSWVACLFLHIATAPAATQAIPAVLPNPRQVRKATRFAIVIMGMAVLAELFTQAWYGWREMSLIHHPQWTAQLAQGGRVEDITLPETERQALFCDFYRAGKWQDAVGNSWSAFWFRYNPKPSNRVVLGWHTPDHCLPSVGWKKEETYPMFVANANGLELQVQANRFSVNGSTVFVFWVIYPTSGNLPNNLTERNHLVSLSKFRMHLDDVWSGNRGTGVETLETTLTGPTTFETAQAAYVNELKKIIVPDTAVATMAPKAS